ncbi:SusC/RagA family TonB-linked outer membrane protein [Pontibacter sp. H249]|uniref:SusC/RagA family TonB-linked outer membrane protein n=1 Tax=Pontibacter sp. H249 TaxID=3133420 RepID=UPI0030BFFFCC
MKSTLLFLSLLLLPLWALAQQVVRGRVLSAANQSPLPGATVLVKGTEQGTTADVDGYFTLQSVPAGAILQANFLGYAQREVALPTPLPQLLVISLTEQSSQLGEVVVSTGYQDLPQERATGSFAHVSREQLQQQVSTDVLSRLEAVASGLTVDRGTGSQGQFLVRGLSTIQGPREPLIVVDNFPYEGDLRNINPNDVESVTILKDAAAASIWGARAGNGVIVITTRKGRFNQPLRAEFITNVTFTGKPDLSSLPQLSSSDYIDLEQFLFDKGHYNSQINSASRPALTPAVEILLAQRNGTLTEEEAQTQLNALRSRDVRDDYLQYMYRNSVNQQYSLGLQGGTHAHGWRLSGGYDRNLSVLDAGYNRLNLAMQHTLRPLKNLELTSGLRYTQSQSTSGRPAYGDITSQSGNLYPYARFADDNGKPLPLPRDFRQSWKETAGDGKLLDWNYYPLTEHLHNHSTDNLQDLVGHGSLRYTLPLGLEASVRYQYQRQQAQGERLQDPESYGARSIVNRYTQINPNTGALTYIVPKGGILDLSHDLVEAHNARGQLNFDKTTGEHTFVALAGGEVRHTRTTGNNNRRYGYDPDLLTFGQVDYVNLYPSIVNGSLSNIPDNSGQYARLTRFISVFGNAAYTYKHRYTLTGSARQDASNLFGVKANDRWKPLWSAGMGWELSREPFYQVGLVPYLKLRATYGYSGNVDQRLAAVTTIAYRLALSAQTKAPWATFDNFANPELRWETARMLNLGLDFRLRNDALSGSVEYYRKKGTDLFGRESIDYTSGIGWETVKNVASMEGSGVDVRLQSTHFRRGGFRWESDLNFNYYADRVTAYHLSELRGSRFISAGTTISGVEGRPVYAIFSYPWAGLNPQTGDPQGYLEGQVSTDYTALLGPDVLVSDLVYHGSALPTYFGSLGSTLAYKRFSLTARLSYKLGYYFRRESVNYGNLYSTGLAHADYTARWQQPGDETNTYVPSQVYPAIGNRDTFYAGSGVLVERGDHVRLQYLTASYDLSATEGRKLPFQRLQVYANAQNLGLLWTANKLGIDPDYNLSRYALPQARSYSLGLKAFFN